MSHFLKQLGELSTKATASRRWVFVPYDQLTEEWGPVASTPPDELGLVLVESREKGSRRPYHKQKLALILANQRQYALEQAARGVAIEYVRTQGSISEALRDVAGRLGSLDVQRPAEFELRMELAHLEENGVVRVIDHEGWLTTSEQFRKSQSKRPWRMDAFYRRVRQDSGILMEDGAPVGGKYSFDAENRQRWNGDPPLPELPRFDEEDPVKLEVASLIEAKFSDHPGRVDLAALPATKEDAERQWTWALDRCLESFGPYQDAMTTESSNLFHTRVSALLHIGRLDARRVVDDVVRADALPMASREGFIRQVLGWREYVRHVHEATDGFRRVPERRVSTRTSPGDGGFERWSGTAWAPKADPPTGVDGGAVAAALTRGVGVPPAYWGTESGLHCLDQVVREVWDEGYGHHITRLMVLANIGTLLDLSARDLADWFWIAYTDAYDWVVEPNVMGMGTYGVGALMTTKPYVSGAAYIDRMSDYCSACAFHPKKNCPITRLYWAFLDRHRETLDGNHRLRMPYATLKKRAGDKREEDARVFQTVREKLGRGERLEPEDFDS